MPRRLSPDRSANASWERPAASRYCRSSTPNVTGLWSMLVLDDPAVGGDSTSAHSPTVLQPAPAVLCDHRSPRLAHEVWQVEDGNGFSSCSCGGGSGVGRAGSRRDRSSVESRQT